MEVCKHKPQQGFQKGHSFGNRFKKGHTPWHKGMKIDRTKYPNYGHLQKHTEEAKDKMSQTLKKNTTRYWLNKKRPEMSGENHYGYGKPRTKATKKKMSQNYKYHISSGCFKKGHIPWHKGKKLHHLTGENASHWQGGKTPLYKSIRQSFENKEWIKGVFERDNYICQECGVHSGLGKAVRLEAHHMKPFAQILCEFLKEYNQFSPVDDKETLVRLAIKYEPFWDIDNGETLCKDCHNKTKGQFYAFKDMASQP